MDGLTADKAVKQPKIPEGYDTIEAFLKEARERFQEGVDADRENRNMALDDQRFIANDQWDETVKARRIAKGRPCLSINTLPQYLGQVVGDMLMNQPAIKVRPSEGGDKAVADVRQGLIRYIENRNNAAQVYVGAGESQVGCGLGHFRVGTAYSNDDTFDQDIEIKSIPNPFAVVWDAFSVEPTGADARFCFVVEEMPRLVFEEAYPDAQSSELMVPLQGSWATKDTVRVTEYWTMKEEKRTLALLQRSDKDQPTMEDVTDADEATMALVVKDANDQPRVREKMVSRACMYLITGQDILAGPVEYPIKRFPIFKVTGRTQQVGDRTYRYSLIRFAKDPIRLRNLSRSAAAEYLSMSPRAQWLLHEADRDKAKQYREAHKSGDPTLFYSGDRKPERIDPPMAPNALFQESQFYDQDIKDTTGLHDASLGMKSNETSGKAILARERQGDTATAMYQFNLKAAIRECGRVINDLIPVVFDTARTIVALGEDGSAKAVRVNDPNAPDGHIDLKTGKYDIEIETGPSYSTRRVEAAESMMAFIQAVPGAAQIAGDLIASAQDWPDADKIAARLKKALPPGVVEDDDEDLNDEQKAAKQQAAQAAQAEQAKAKELALRGAELALDEQQAKVLKMDADAQLSQAKARETAKGDPADPEKPLDDALKLQQVRLAEAQAEKAEFDAQLSQLAVTKAERELAVMLAMPAAGKPPEAPVSTGEAPEAAEASEPALEPAE
jgi:hypothetical protein